MSEEIKNEVVPEAVSDVVENIAKDIVEDAIAEAVAEKAAEIAAEILDEAKPEEAPEETKETTAISTADLARSSAEKQALGSVAEGVIGVSTTAPAPKKKAVAPKAKKSETVAIYSTRNVTWNGVGKVYIGYNIVDKAAADKWLSRSHTRLATPEEVAKEFGK